MGVFATRSPFRPNPLGLSCVRGKFNFTNDSVANIVIGLVYFCVIACSFFITYKVVWRKPVFGAKKETEGEVEA